MRPIYIKTTGGAAKKAQSKLLGAPDVWEGFEWPTAEFCDELDEDITEDVPLSFVCQINCAEASKLDRNGVLPKTGMLYFFYDLETKPYSTDMADDCARVLYYDGDLAALKPYVWADGEGPCQYRELPIEFSAENTDECHQLLGEEYYLSDDYPAPPGRTLLFGMGEIMEDDFEINFVDCGILLFFIEPEKLKNKDFSDIIYRLGFM